MTRAPDFHGTHAQALEFALNVHEDPLQTYEFLKAWREGDLGEWPEFYEWLDQQPTPTPTAAEPAYPVQSVVDYIDRHERPQRGRVRSIDARWAGYASPTSPPLIVYRLEHPTYRNGHFYTTADRIRRRVDRAR